MFHFDLSTLLLSQFFQSGFLPDINLWNKKKTKLTVHFMNKSCLVSISGTSPQISTMASSKVCQIITSILGLKGSSKGSIYLLMKLKSISTKWIASVISRDGYLWQAKCILHIIMDGTHTVCGAFSLSGISKLEVCKEEKCNIGSKSKPWEIFQMTNEKRELTAQMCVSWHWQQNDWTKVKAALWFGFLLLYCHLKLFLNK